MGPWTKRWQLVFKRMGLPYIDHDELITDCDNECKNYAHKH